VGGFVGSPFLNWLIQSLGWRTAVLILGIVLGVFTFLAAMVLVGHPREKGLRPYGARPPEGAARDESADGSGPHPRPPEPSAEPQWTVRKAVKTREFLVLYAMLLLAEIALMGVMTHLFTHATESGVPKEAVSWAYGVIGVASVVGKIGGGALSDRVGRKLTFLLAFALKGTGFLLLLAAPNLVLLFIFSVILGLSYGAWTPVFPAVVGDFFGPRAMGRIYSVLTTTFLLGGICGPILAGRVFDRTGSYLAAFVFFSIICYVAACLSLFVKPPATAAAK
jgi:MFS family permease